MKPILLMLVFMFFISLTFTFANQPRDNLVCEWVEGACSSPNNYVFSVAGSFVGETASGTVLSSPVRLLGSNAMYNSSLCCRLGDHIEEDLNFTFASIAEGCPAGFDPLLYFTADTNARIATEFDVQHHLFQSCVRLPTQFASMDIKVSSDFDRFNNLLNYQCLYRFNQNQSGLAGSCDSSFGSNQIYEYTVWARVWEDLGSLDCTSDCTSRLDNRVYSQCAAFVNSCFGVPSACDGSIYGSWVQLDLLREVQCSAPWTNTRFRAFTQDPVRVSTQNNECLNLLSNSFTVFVNNQPVTMRVYTCLN